ncbi:Transcriptional regulator, AbiEi antitoxin, Type IV TA system [Microlunatus sagamiharensis]|uniref:Transcriptional regulator, AbiEi antitoxin, Type IV TA system n=1 Tax=Microlunatus sagamiharensis TaxID=546874 RepID=A0A1H2LXM9_9ACTN|nr:hypothetical protein [Microlunatus sagamiharensis]SDU85612.1 Transcriptional regulator, AbiEi antitoxin, Type IV TA system [Microlunatus sagamiharensis]
MDVLLRSWLVSRGLSDQDLGRLQAVGDLVRLRRGGYLRGDVRDLTPEDRHRLLVQATVPLLERGSTLSHGSAAVVHGLPVDALGLAQVHLTRPRRGGGRTRALVRVHTSALAEHELEERDGLRLTSLARTVVDVARSMPFERAVPTADRALRLGLDRDALDAALVRAARWPGAPVARRVAAFADGRSESVGESLSRVLLAERAVPAPELQLPVLDGRHLVARVDFAWPDAGVVGEFDGKVKYGRLLAEGDDVREVVHREKLREDALRDLGWQVVRWTWPDLARPEVVVDRLARAFRRARR